MSHPEPTDLRFVDPYESEEHEMSTGGNVSPIHMPMNANSTAHFPRIRSRGINRSRPSVVRSQRLDYTEESCKMRLLKDRLDVAFTAIRIRKEMGAPITLANIDSLFPEDIAKFLKLPNTF